MYKNNMDILVSVIIPTYKRPKTLGRAIDSVLNQTYKNIELIVVDDNDPDTDYRKDTEKVLNSYLTIDKRVKYIQHERNKNGAAARNTGIRNSSGYYICFLDDDDYFFPERIELMLSFLIKNQNYDGVYCGWMKNNYQYLPELKDSYIENLLMGKTFIYTPTTLLIKEKVIKINGWSELISKHQDSEFIIKYIAAGNKLFPLRKVLVYIDEYDRSQVAIGKNWEYNTILYLEIMKPYIQEIQKIDNKFNKKLLCNRYLSILLNYLKYKYFVSAIRIYFKLFIKYPIYFNKVLFIYSFNKIKNEFKTISIK